MLNKAIVRDGKPYPPASLAEMEIVETAARDLARLKDLGFLLLVVTNQPDVARGTQPSRRSMKFTTPCGKLCPWTSSWSVPMTTATAATAGNRRLV